MNCQDKVLNRLVLRRETLLAAAERCFIRRGFHDTSMADISKAANMSQGNIYHYFMSKDDIILAFVQSSIDACTARVNELMRQADPLQATYDDVERCIRERQFPFVLRFPLLNTTEATRNYHIAALVQAADVQTRKRLLALLISGRRQRSLCLDEATLNGRIEAICALFQGLELVLAQPQQPAPDSVAIACRLTLKELLFAN